MRLRRARASDGRPPVSPDKRGDVEGKAYTRQNPCKQRESRRMHMNKLTFMNRRLIRRPASADGPEGSRSCGDR